MSRQRTHASPRSPRSSTIPATALVGATVLFLLVSLAAVGALASAAGATQTASPAGPDAPLQTVDPNASAADHNAEPPIEDAFARPAPEPGDEYYEAADEDAGWISYANPRDEYRAPYLGDGSGKICTTLLNEEGEPIVGEAIPETTVTIPTGSSISWHTHADPLVVEYPLTESAEFPLDADQFGTSDDLPQGDGYMDSHCIEIHGLPEDATVEFGEPEIDGEYADWIDVVGYHTVEGEAWDTDVDPIEDAVSYEETGGEWTYEPGASHGQAVVVLQLDPPEDAYADYPSDGSDAGAEGTESTDTDTETETPEPSTETDATESSSDDGEESTDSTERSDAGDDSAENLPGFGPLAAIGVLVAAALAIGRR